MRTYETHESIEQDCITHPPHLYISSPSINYSYYGCIHFLFSKESLRLTRSEAFTTMVGAYPCHGMSIIPTRQ